MAFKNETYNLKKAGSYKYNGSRIKLNTTAKQSDYCLLCLRFIGYARKDIQHAFSLLQHQVNHSAYNLGSIKQKNYEARFKTNFQYELRHINNATLGQQGKQIQKTFTVIRSPFVYKKTREQFGLKKHTKVIHLSIKRQSVDFFCRILSTLTLPCELKLVFYA